MSKFKSASQGEILRAAQKDESFIDVLSRNISNLCLELVGPRVWIHYKWLCDPSSRILYYLITTCSDYQTLGEEYTGIIQVDNTRRKIPSKLSRLIMVILQTFGPVLLKKLLNRMKKSVVEQENQSPNVERILSLAEKSLTFIEKLNVCLFYFDGIYYHLSKRLTGIKYIKYSGLSGTQDNTRTTFKTLGIIAGSHLLLSALYELFQLLKTSKRQVRVTNNNLGDVGNSEQCPLCLERLGTNGGISVTTCSHLFCWSCIMASINSAPACPLCRHNLSINNVIPVRNIL